MDALSSLSASSTVTAASYLAATAAGATGSAVSDATTDSSSAAASIRTIFSDFAKQLLADQANDPTLSIDAALTKNLLSPTINYSAGGQLYTSAGLLQQFTTSLFLSQLDDSQNASDPNSTGAILANNFGLSNSNTNNQTLLSLINAYTQISLLGGLPVFSTSDQTSNAPDNSSTFSRFIDHINSTQDKTNATATSASKATQSSGAST